MGIALARAERNETETAYVLAAIRLLIFTGCRRDEILRLRWDHVDLQNALLRLPGQVVSADRSAPLLPFAKTHAYRLIAIAEDDRLFPHVGTLPSDSYTLHKLTQLSNERFGGGGALPGGRPAAR